MEVLARERKFKRRPAPEVVIDIRWNGLRSVNFADAGTALVAEAAGNFDFAKMSFLDPGHGSFNASNGGAALRPGLHDFVVLARELNNAPPFAHVMRNRLFDIDILARLDGPDGAEGVPMVRRGAGHRI